MSVKAWWRWALGAIGIFVVALLAIVAYALLRGFFDLSYPSFSMTLQTGEDFRKAGERLDSLMPDFDCTGEGREEPNGGALRCEGGFECILDASEPASQQVACRVVERTVGAASYCYERAAPLGGFGFELSCVGPKAHTDCSVEELRDATPGQPRFRLSCERPV